MDNAERVLLFQKALSMVEKLEVQNSGYPPLESIHNQLLYLIDLATDQKQDTEDELFTAVY